MRSIHISGLVFRVGIDWGAPSISAVSSLTPRRPASARAPANYSVTPSGLSLPMENLYFPAFIGLLATLHLADSVIYYAYSQCSADFTLPKFYFAEKP
ncbi:hypothetical protein EVAR_59992_1 [Eumeta japonica]|uniref:Uncharacterized protein n=1 Tax=Eumeta variegata TaxID=151549 RepID=A0A4C1ZI96_EUMVA|nr:hypothetical protein EVAR_59992_1 [Eumeta japonica]